MSTYRSSSWVCCRIWSPSSYWRGPWDARSRPLPSANHTEGAERRPERSGAEAAVPVVAQAGHDVFRRVQLSVPGGGEYVDVRMSLLEGLDAFWCGDHANQPDAVRPVLFEDLHGLDGGPAGGQHRVEDHGDLAPDVGGQLDVVAGGDRRALVALEAYVTDRDLGQQLQHRRHKSQAGPQDGNGHHAVGHGAALRLLQRRVHPEGAGCTVAGCFGGQEAE